MLNSQRLKHIKVGDVLIFTEGDVPFFVRHQDYRYALACTVDGQEYTIIDRKDRVTASTTMIFESLSNFNRKENCLEMLDLLHRGKRELSLRYSTSFSAWDTFGATIGSRVFSSDEYDDYLV